MLDGAPQALVRYLNAQPDAEVTYVGHPLKSGFSHHEFVVSSQGIRRIWKKLDPIITVPILCWIWDIILTIYWIILSKKRYHTCVAAGCVNVVTAILLKKLGIVKIVIFYSIDFVPKRFNNSILNLLYRLVDNFAFIEADITWCLTNRMLTERTRLVGSFRSTKRDIIIPIGIDATLPPFDEAKIKRYTMVFTGVLLEKQGLQIVIPALRPLQAKYPDIRLRIVGDGPFLGELRKLTEKFNVEHLVDFCGLITDRGQLAERVGTAAVGLAPYAPTSDSFTWYADPTKPKDYMSLGIPVIITEVPEIASKIHQSGAGQLVSYDVEDISDAIDRFLGDDEYWRNARQSAIRLSHDYHWDAIFERALASSM